MACPVVAKESYHGPLRGATMARRSKISPEKLAALKATIMAYATELELRGFSRRQIAMGMFGKALELLVDEVGSDEGKSEALRALIHAAETHLDVGSVQH
jgi:hypothetical protein